MDPARPEAHYAGYVLWRVIVPEEALAGTTQLPEAHEPSRELLNQGQRLITYPVPGASGISTRGHRRLNVVWYDPARKDLLTSAGLLNGQTVTGSLQADAFPRELCDELTSTADRAWPSPWREALSYGF